MDVELKTLREIMVEMGRAYDRNPRGWGMCLTRDEGGYGNVFIQGPRGLWQVKVDSIYKPRPVGLGARVEDAGEFRELFGERTPPFGFRSITRAQIAELQRRMSGHRPLSDVIEEILSASPAPVRRLRSPGIAQGPVIYSGFRGYVSKDQRELDLKLKRGLDRLLAREGIGGMVY